MRALALRDRLAELPYRLRRRHVCKELTWPVAVDTRNRLSIVWPTKYDWPLAAGIVETLRDGLGRICRMSFAPTPQPFHHVVMLSCSWDGGAPFAVAIDYNDLPVVQASALSETLIYFKLECAAQGYSDPRVVAGGYPTTGLDFYKYFRPYRAAYGQARSIDVLARFGYRFQGDLRRKAVSLVTGVPNWRVMGNTGKVRYSRYLREAAAARLCLDLPGNGYFTHRVAEFLGIGTCMVSIPHDNVLHVPMKSGVHYVEVAGDLTDLVSTCEYYLANPEERERIAAAGAKYFDEYLHCDQLAAYYVNLILGRLRGATP